MQCQNKPIFRELPNTKFVMDTDHCKNWPGDYNFNVSINESLLPSWTFSRILDTLFATMDTPWPIIFSTKLRTPKYTVLRGRLIYSNSIDKLVATCFKHERASDEDLATHIFRCAGSAGVYYQSMSNSRSVSIFYDPECTGSRFSFLKQFYFACCSSCLDEQIQLMFTLETNGSVIGRRIMKLHISDEPMVSKIIKEAVYRIYKTEGSVTKEDDKKTFTITVDNKRHFKIINMLASDLKLME